MVYLSKKKKRHASFIFFSKLFESNAIYCDLHLISGIHKKVTYFFLLVNTMPEYFSTARSRSRKVIRDIIPISQPQDFAYQAIKKFWLVFTLSYIGLQHLFGISAFPKEITKCTFTCNVNLAHC